MGTLDILEGRLHPMPSDPVALRKGTRSVMLWTMALPTALASGHLAWLIGVSIGRALAPYFDLNLSI